MKTARIQLKNDFTPYPDYKESGIEWIGRIPKEWELNPWRSVLTERKEKNNKLVTDNILSVTKDRGVIRYADKGDIGNKSSDRPENYKIVYPNDIVINSMNLVIGSVGIARELGVTSSVYLIYRANKEKVYIDYFHYLIRTVSFQKYIARFGKGIMELRESIKADDLRKQLIAIPPLETQKKIAEYLDEKTAYIDQIIEKKQKQIELLKEEIVSIAQNEQMNGKGKTIRIKDLFKLAEKPIEVEDYSEYVALGLYNRGRGLFTKDPQLGKDIKESDFYKVTPRDLIISGQFAWEGAVALASKDESECVVSHRYYLLRDGVVKTEYLLALLMTKFGDHILNESSRGSAGRNRPLNIKILLKEKIRVPSKEAETKAESLLIKIALVRNNIKKSIEVLQEFKSSLISHVVTGKIKV